MSDREVLLNEKELRIDIDTQLPVSHDSVEPRYLHREYTLYDVYAYIDRSCNSDFLVIEIDKDIIFDKELKDNYEDQLNEALEDYVINK